MYPTWLRTAASVCSQVPWQPAAVFAALLLLTLLVNLNQVRVSKPVELLRGGNAGEREPKTRRLQDFLQSALRA